jgi:hypothetical protein
VNSADEPLKRPIPTDLEPGVYRLHGDVQTPALMIDLHRTGWATTTVDLRGAADKPAILEAFARGLDFPSWVGRNWDALDDALRDLSWWPAATCGRVILVCGWSRSPGAPLADLAIARDVLDTAVAAWAQSEAPLVVLLSDGQPDPSASALLAVD